MQQESVIHNTITIIQYSAHVVCKSESQNIVLASVDKVDKR